MKDIRVAVLGASGWMGKVHTMAFQTFPHFFGASGGTARVTALVEANPDAAHDLRFRAPDAVILTNWQDAVNDPDIDLIDICLPDSLHYTVAKAALLAGKHVYCEKPLADTAAEAKELADLARAKGVITRVGLAFPRNPVHDLARQIITSGQIGDLTLFKACQHVDVFGDPAAPFMWRADGKLAPTGIIGDTGSHVFSFMDFLVGPISSLIADTIIFTTARPHGTGMADVTNPDAAHVMCRFANGARGIADFSRIATGRKFRQTYEVYGTKGSITYDYDQVNRLQLYTTADVPGQQGYRAIDVGPDHPSYAAFLPLPNFALGYNEMKIIEAAEVIRSITTGRAMWPAFDVGHRICQMVEACMDSARRNTWVDIPAA